MRNIKAYLKPTSIHEAVNLLRVSPSKTRCIAGGTYVAATPDPEIEFLVDITGSQLNYLCDQGETVRIGACTTLEEIAQSDALKTFAGGILTEAARWTGSIQFRNAATLGGHLAMQAEIALPLIALDAQVVIVGDGERALSLEEFYGNGGKATLRNHLIKECVLPGASRHAVANIIRMSRTHQDAALVAVAVAAWRDQQDCQTVRIAVMPVTTGITRLPHAEAVLEGKNVTEKQIADAVEIAVKEVTPIHDFRASAAYRRKIIGVYAKRALSACFLNA